VLKVPSNPNQQPNQPVYTYVPTKKEKEVGLKFKAPAEI